MKPLFVSKQAQWRTAAAMWWKIVMQTSSLSHSTLRNEWAVVRSVDNIIHSRAANSIAHLRCHSDPCVPLARSLRTTSASTAAEKQRTPR